MSDNNLQEFILQDGLIIHISGLPFVLRDKTVVLGRRENFAAAMDNYKWPEPTTNHDPIKIDGEDNCSLVISYEPLILAVRDGDIFQIKSRTNNQKSGIYWIMCKWDNRAKVNRTG